MRSKKRIKTSATYIGPVWISKFLPIVGQGCANSITTTPCCRDRTDRWTLNRQHFPLMLLVPRLKSMKQKCHSNCERRRKKNNKIRAYWNETQKKNCLSNSIVAAKRCWNSHCVNTYSFAIRMWALRDVIVGWHCWISMVAVPPNFSMNGWLATSSPIHFRLNSAVEKTKQTKKNSCVPLTKSH